jgi:hypothetical protein
MSAAGIESIVRRFFAAGCDDDGMLDRCFGTPSWITANGAVGLLVRGFTAGSGGGSTDGTSDGATFGSLSTAPRMITAGVEPCDSRSFDANSGTSDGTSDGALAGSVDGPGSAATCMITAGAGAGGGATSGSFTPALGTAGGRTGSCMGCKAGSPGVGADAMRGGFNFDG